MLARLRAALRGALWRIIFVALTIGGGVAYANYNATQGVGTAFGSIVVSAVHYAQQLLCDPTTPAQCAAVSAGGAVKVDGSAATQPVSSATLATAANQTTANTSLATIATNTGASVPAGSATIGGTIPVAGTTGAATITSAIAPATPAGVNLKASAGTVYGVHVTTIQATPVYVKFYNSASAPTCGSGTPVARFMVPAASTAANGAGTNIQFTVGAAFGTGIGYCVTGALADNDTTAIIASNTLVNVEWQ